MKKNTVTQDQIDALLDGAEIKVQTLFNKCAVVTVKLKNGFTISESSGCVDEANYDESLGVKICLDRIKNELWKLEGYRLQQSLHELKEAEKKGEIVPTPSTPKSRAQDELKELTDKYKKLDYFITSSTKPLSDDAQNLLYRQRDIMREYIGILSMRLAIWED